MNIPVWMYIDKFDREVLIDPEHPLALAQAQRDAERLAQKEPTLPPELVPVVTELKKPVVTPTKSKKKR